MSGALPAIEIRDTWYRYSRESAEWVLNGVDLELAVGSLTVLTGPSGCGKSTLLYLVGGLLDRSGDLFKGSVRTRRAARFDTQPISEASVGLLLQDPARQLHQLTVLDELRSGPLYAGATWHEADAQARLAAAGLVSDTLFCASPWKISVGQQQRVALASLLSLHRDVLLLDEPFSCLDGSGARDLLQVLQKLVDAGKTVVVCTHDTSWLGDRPQLVVLMEAGRVTSIGPPEEVLPSSDFARAVGTPLSIRVGSAVNSVAGTRSPLITWCDVARASLPSTKLACFSSPTTGLAKANHSTSGPELLKVQHLYAGWTSDRWTIEDVALSLRRGDILGIVGRNGSGKSTLGQALFAAVPRIRGEFRLASGVIARKPRPTPGDFCYLAQNPSDMLFETTCLREVAFGPRLLRRPAPNPTARVALTEVGLETRSQEHPRALSVGQQRLVTLASVLACQPTLLLLDEPEYGLDQKSWESVAKIVRNKAASGLGIILITHNLELVFSTCTHLLIIEGGRAAWFGPADVTAVTFARHLLEPLSTQPEGLEWMAWSCTNGLADMAEEKLTSTLEALYERCP